MTPRASPDPTRDMDASFPVASSFEAFLAAPEGQSFADDCLVVARSGHTQLVAVRGDVTDASAERLVAAAALPSCAATLLDLRLLNDLSLGQYELLFGFIAVQAVRAAQGHRTAVVLTGASGAATALGYATMSQEPLAQRAFACGVAALAFLGHDHAQGSWEAWEALLKRSALPAWLVRMRQTIREDLGGADLEGVAAHIGMSTRALQRSLQEADLTFRDELARERVKRACDLIDGGQTKLLAVALDAGFGKVASMNLAFERVLGVPARARASAARRESRPPTWSRKP